MNDIDALLQRAGERWRETQPDPPTVDPAAFTVRARSAVTPVIRIATTGLAAVVVVGLVAVAVGLGGGRGVGGPPLGGLSPTPSAAEAGPSTTTEASAAASLTCDVTRPTDPFVPPDGYPAEPPARYESDWYGTSAIWVMLDRDGETWPFEPRGSSGIPQKTFWWSENWAPDEEPEPDIQVVGTRLDRSGSFMFSPGTNASADFGTAMLVGIDIPSEGCWRLTGTYRRQSLSYVVRVGGD